MDFLPTLITSLRLQFGYQNQSRYSINLAKLTYSKLVSLLLVNFALEILSQFRLLMI